MFALNGQTNYATANRPKCSFLIFSKAPNTSNLITVTRPDPYFSFLEMHINFIFVTNNAMMQFIKATIVLFHTLYCSTTLEVGSTRSVSNNVVPQVARHYSYACISITNLKYVFRKLGRNG